MARVIEKVIFLGREQVGKTNVVSAMCPQGRPFRFSPVYKATIGADFLAQDGLEGDLPDDADPELSATLKLIHLQVWDTAGQERFQSLGMAFYRGAKALVLCYDVTSRESFDELQSWMDQFFEQQGDDLQGDKEKQMAFPKMLLGCKTDLLSEGEVPLERAVSQTEAEEWARDHGAIYQEVSAKDGSGVKEVRVNVACLSANQKPFFEFNHEASLVKSAHKQ
jgi:Ras-related protein Rab-7A